AGHPPLRSGPDSMSGLRQRPPISRSAQGRRARCSQTRCGRAPVREPAVAKPTLRLRGVPRAHVRAVAWARRPGAQFAAVAEAEAETPTVTEAEAAVAAGVGPVRSAPVLAARTP